MRGPGAAESGPEPRGCRGGDQQRLRLDDAAPLHLQDLLRPVHHFHAVGGIDCRPLWGVRLLAQLAVRLQGRAARGERRGRHGACGGRRAALLRHAGHWPPGRRQGLPHHPDGRARAAHRRGSLLQRVQRRPAPVDAQDPQGRRRRLPRPTRCDHVPHGAHHVHIRHQRQLRHSHGLPGSEWADGLLPPAEPRMPVHHHKHRLQCERGEADREPAASRGVGLVLGASGRHGHALHRGGRPRRQREQRRLPHHRGRGPPRQPIVVRHGARHGAARPRQQHGPRNGRDHGRVRRRHARRAADSLPQRRLGRGQRAGEHGGGGLRQRWQGPPRLLPDAAGGSNG